MIALDLTDIPADGSDVLTPLILLEGKVTKAFHNFIQVCNVTTKSTINWPIIKGRFRCFILLKPGANLVSVKHGFYTKELNYNLVSRQSPYIVQPLYIVSKDGDGRFQSPFGVDNSSTSAQNRISLGAALLQTFTSLDLKSHDLSASTFQLPLDNETGLPVTKLFTSKYSTHELHAMSERDLWKNIAREIMNSRDLPEKYNSKFLAFLSVTRYDGQSWNATWKHKDVVAATKGHIALGMGI